MNKSNVQFSFDVWDDKLRPESDIQLWKETGMIPHVIYFMPKQSSLSDLINYLDKCYENGVFVTYLDQRTDFRNMTDQNRVEFIAELETVAKDILWHPAIARVCLGDEPQNIRQFEDLVTVSTTLKKFTDKKIGTGFFHWGRGKGFTDHFGFHPSEYEKVLEKYIVQAKLDYFMFDDYSYMSEYFGLDTEYIYFKNLNIFSNLAKKLNKPVYNCALTTGFEHYRQPTAIDHRWLISTTFAYGLKGVNFYTFYDLAEKGGFATSAPGFDSGFPIDRHGNKTFAYYDVMRAVDEFRTRFTGEFDNLELVDVWHYLTSTGGAKMLFDGEDIIDYFHADHGVPCIVSKFYDKKNDGFVFQITNLSRERSEVYVINFKEPYSKYDNHVWLLPGQMSLIKLYGDKKNKI